MRSICVCAIASYTFIVVRSGMAIASNKHITLRQVWCILQHEPNKIGSSNYSAV